MQKMISNSGGAEVTGFGMLDLSVRFGSVKVTVSPSDGGGSGTDPNHGKDGATIASQPGGTPSGGTHSGGISIRF